MVDMPPAAKGQFDVTTGTNPDNLHKIRFFRTLCVRAKRMRWGKLLMH